MGRPTHFGGGPVLKGWLKFANCYEQGTDIFDILIGFDIIGV